jgi:iron complex outermembrane receptor protein
MGVLLYKRGGGRNNNCNQLAIKDSMLFPLILLIPTLLLAHEAQLEDIDVVQEEDTQGLVDFVPSVTKLKGKELSKKRQTSVGDMLGTEAGVQSTSFGPSASRPVIRGLDGDRVRVLQNSLGTIDASTQSLDHAIPVDTLTIDQMEIVRGPMSLLYGSSAIGGVVNLVTNRIHYTYEEGFFSKFLTQGETANNGFSNALHMNYGKDRWMFHVDGSTRNLGNQEIPRYARSTPGPSDKKGELPNSFNQQDNVAVAVSKIGDRGYLGVSFNHYNTFYGSVAEPTVAIDMTQNRFELHGEYRPEGVFRKIKLKSAQSDYFHKELEGKETGTVFTNKGNESRLEGVNKNGNWDGVTGVQTQFTKFGALGDEAFLPKSRSEKAALFSFQQLSLGRHAFRFGGRIENVEVTKLSSGAFGPKDEKAYLGMNASLGHCYDFSKTNTLETSLTYSERAPNFQELFADGDHVATGTFEVGDSQLVKEKSLAFEVTYKNSSARNVFTGSVYTQVFKDYISLNPTGALSADNNPVFAYEQVDALFYGIDLDNKSEIGRSQKGAYYLLSKFDLVRAKDTDSGHNLPRISPPRVAIGLDYETDRWTGELEVQYVAHQTKTAPNETRTEDYTLTNLGYTYHILAETSAIDLFFRVRNVFDVEARNHVSTLKEVAPLPGRNFILGAQAQF